MASAQLEWAVLTWNLQGSKQTDLARVASTIRQQAPDVVALQEVRRSQARELAAELAMQHEWAYKHNAFHPFLGGRAEGSAIMTPHALANVDHLVISDATSKRSFKRRIAQWGVVSRDDASAYRVFNTHLTPHDEPAARLAEAERIAAIAQHLGDAPPTIVAGDLNNEGEPAVIAALPGIEHVTPSPTNPADAPVQRLDHVLLPADATAVSVSVPAGGSEWDELSDHLPVTARFSLQWVQGDFPTPPSVG